MLGISIRRFSGNLSLIHILKIHIPILKDIPILGPLLSGHTAITYIAFLMIILASVLMFKTKFGVYVRVVGENEEAAKAVGIKVNVIKYTAVLIGAVLCEMCIRDRNDTIP